MPRPGLSTGFVSGVRGRQRRPVGLVTNLIFGRWSPAEGSADRMRNRRLLSLTPLALALVLARPASAQLASDGSNRASRAPQATCSYRDCALGIVPTWNGLAVVRGAAGPR